MEIKLEYFVPAIQIAGQVRIRCKDIYVNLFDLPFSNGFDRYGCFQKSKQKFFRYIIYILTVINGNTRKLYMPINRKRKMLR